MIFITIENHFKNLCKTGVMSRNWLPLADIKLFCYHKMTKLDSPPACSQLLNFENPFSCESWSLCMNQFHPLFTKTKTVHQVILKFHNHLL